MSTRRRGSVRPPRSPVGLGRPRPKKERTAEAGGFRCGDVCAGGGATAQGDLIPGSFIGSGTRKHRIGAKNKHSSRWPSIAWTVGECVPAPVCFSFFSASLSIYRADHLDIKCPSLANPKPRSHSNGSAEIPACNVQTDRTSHSHHDNFPLKKMEQSSESQPQIPQRSIQK